MDGLLLVVLVTVLLFAVTNGFHDTAIAIASSVSTGSLTPGVAVVMAAFFNALGTVIGLRVAITIDSSLIAVGVGDRGLIVIGCGVLAAIIWNLATWWRAIPSSSTHALVGGLVGAGVASDTFVGLPRALSHGLLPLLVYPVIVCGLAMGAMILLVGAVHRQAPVPTNRRLRKGQAIAAAAVALGHGMQDGQKTIAVLMLTLAAGGVGVGYPPPAWVPLAAAAAMAFGTLLGGWRIVRTLGRGITRLEPASGFAVEGTTAGVLLASTWAGIPVSTTYTVTAAVTGVGLTRGPRHVRWWMLRLIALTWVFTIPATALLGAALAALLA